MWHIFTFLQLRKVISLLIPRTREYNRNMVTGASTSQVSIILIDARKGVIEQTYRHFYQ
jgi:sulfate adenylyltransferase subunit 1